MLETRKKLKKHCKGKGLACISIFFEGNMSFSRRVTLHRRTSRRTSRRTRKTGHPASPGLQGAQPDSQVPVLSLLTSSTSTDGFSSPAAPTKGSTAVGADCFAHSHRPSGGSSPSLTDSDDDKSSDGYPDGAEDGDNYLLLHGKNSAKPAVPKLVLTPPNKTLTHNSRSSDVCSEREENGDKDTRTANEKLTHNNRNNFFYMVPVVPGAIAIPAAMIFAVMSPASVVPATCLFLLGTVLLICGWCCNNNVSDYPRPS